MKMKTKTGSKKQGIDKLQTKNQLLNSQTTDDKLLTNEPICPGSNPGGAILDGSGWLVVGNGQKPPIPTTEELWNCSQDKLKEIVKQEDIH